MDSRFWSWPFTLKEVYRPTREGKFVPYTAQANYPGLKLASISVECSCEAAAYCRLDRLRKAKYCISMSNMNLLPPEYRCIGSSASSTGHTLRHWRNMPRLLWRLGLYGPWAWRFGLPEKTHPYRNVMRPCTYSRISLGSSRDYGSLTTHFGDGSANRGTYWYRAGDRLDTERQDILPADYQIPIDLLASGHVEMKIDDGKP